MVFVIDLVPSYDYQDIYRSNNFISESLITPGFPSNWTNETVIVPGISTEAHINISKLEEFDEMPYSQTKALLHAEHEYVFFFKNSTDHLNISGCVHGYPLEFNTTTCEPDLTSLGYDNLVTVSRLIIHDGKIIRMIVYSWR